MNALRHFQDLRLSIGWRVRWFAMMALALSLVGVTGTAKALTPQLRRYPYLTDAVAGNATINWATDQSASTGYVTYGAVGTEACTAHQVSATKTSISVNSVSEYQWKARLTGLSGNTQYCYRVFLNGADLLGADASPAFWKQVPAGSTRTYTFGVLGDWGALNGGTTNPNQANLMNTIAASGVRFMVGTGDTAYPSGSQTNYGDLYQTGTDISTVFGPDFYKKIGATAPMFNAVGNHGRNGTYLMLWPSAAAAAGSGGAYAMQTYCCVNGTSSASYPSAWYAFDAGRARIYILDASWTNSNVGTGTLYSDDYAAHWAPGTAERTWLANDLAAHPGGLKIAVAHFPMYSDNATEPTDSYMHGPGSLGELLSQNGVQLVLNGHAHIYQRNFKQPGESFVSYTTGGGGATLEPVGSGVPCGSYDAYAVGWSPTKLKGYACGGAAVPSSAAQVTHFLKVTVSSSSVKVEPTDSTGHVFDPQTYNF